MQDASASADRFTSGIASTVSGYTGLFDQYGRTIASTVQPLESLTKGHVSLTNEVVRAGKAAEGMGFNFRFAFFGIKDLMEGRTKFAIAELANELVAMGGTALIVAGGLAAVGVAGFAIYKIVNYARDAREETQKLTEALSALDRPITRVNDELTLSADKLANEIAKLEHKPENGLAIALDEARVLSDKLTDSLDKTLKAVGELMDKQKTPWYELLTPGTKETDKRLEELKRQVNADSGNPAAQQQDFQYALQQVQGDIVKALTTRSKEMGRVDFGPELARLREYATVYQGEIDHIAKEQQVADLTQKRDKLKASEESRKNAEEALKKQAEAIKTANSEMLADLKIDHELSKAEEIDFWQRRLAEVDQYGDRYKGLHREILTTIGTLTQEQDKERDKDSESLQKWAQKLHDTNERVAVSNRELTDKFAEHAEKYAQSRAKIEAADAKKIFEPKANIEQTPITVPIQERLGGTPIGGALNLEQAHIRTTQVLEFQIEQERQLLGFAQRGNVPIQERLALQERILQMQIALAASQGTSDRADKIALASLQFQQTLIQWKSLGIGDAVQSVQGALLRVPGALGGALSKGIIDGKNIGKEIANSLKSIGQQLFGQLITQAIEKMIAELIVNTAIGAWLGTVFGTSASAQVAASAANTAALHANTLAQLKSGVGGIAGGASGAAGSAAGAASSVATGFAGPLIAAAGGIIGGFISGIFSLIGDNRIVKAVNGTTAAVLSLRGNIGTSATPGTPSNASSPSPGASQGGLAGFFGSILGIGGAKPLDVNIVSISPLSPLKGLFNLFGFADGGIPPLGVPSMVGENGPELFIPHQLGTIIPNDQLRGFNARGGNNLIQSSTGHTFNGDLHFHGVQDVRSMMRAIASTAKTASPVFSPFAR